MLRIALAVSLLVTGLSAEAAKAPCTPQEVASVKLLVRPEGRVFLPAKLGDHEVYFELALGTGHISIAESAVAPLGLESQHRVRGAEMKSNDQVVRRFVPLESLAVGDFKFGRRLAPVIPQPEVDSPIRLDDRILAGTIGATMIRNIDIELNLAEQRLKLFKPFKCVGSSPVYWGEQATMWPTRFDPGGALVFTLELEGQKIESGLLAGRNVSLIDSRVTKQFFGFDEHSEGIAAEPTGSGERSVFHAMSITGKDLRIEQQRVELREGWSGCKITGASAVYGAIGYYECIGTVPFQLGADALKHLRLYYAAQRQTIYVTPVPSQP